MNIAKKGVFRLWLVSSICWIFGVISYNWHQVEYSYQFLLKDKNFIKQSADLSCSYQVAIDEMRHPQEVPRPPIADSTSASGFMTRITEETNESLRQSREDDIICNPGGWKSSKPLDEVMLCKAKRFDERVAADNKRKADIAAQQRKLEEAYAQIARVKEIHDLAVCVQNYKLPEPQVDWLLLALIPPSLGVLFMYLLMMTLYRIGNWVWRGFK